MKPVACQDDAGIAALIAIQTRDILSEQYGMIERHLLEGADRLIVETEIGSSGLLSRVLYEIPRWRDHPKNRFRIWAARRRYQRSATGL